MLLNKKIFLIIVFCLASVALTANYVTAQNDNKTILIPQVSIPGSDYTTGAKIEVAGSTKTLADYIIVVFKFLIGLIGIISTVVLMFAGMRWLTAGGNSEIIGEAKKYIISSISGLLLALGSFLLLSTVNIDLIKFNPKEVKKIAYTSLEFGCCEKITNGVKTTVDLVKEACTTEETGATSATFKGEFYSAMNNECVLDKGCCFLNIPHGTQVGWYNNGTTEKICLNLVKEPICKDRDKSTVLKAASKTLATLTPLTTLSVMTNFINSISDQTTTDFKINQKCKQWSECTKAGVIIE